MVPGFYETAAQRNVFKDFLKSHSHFFALNNNFLKIYFKVIDKYFNLSILCLERHFFLPTICRIISQIYWCILNTNAFKFVSLNHSFALKTKEVTWPIGFNNLFWSSSIILKSGILGQNYSLPKRPISCRN